MADWKDKNLQMFGGDVEKKIKGVPFSRCLLAACEAPTRY